MRVSDIRQILALAEAMDRYFDWRDRQARLAEERRYVRHPVKTRTVESFEQGRFDQDSDWQRDMAA